MDALMTRPQTRSQSGLMTRILHRPNPAGSSHDSPETRSQIGLMTRFAPTPKPVGAKLMIGYSRLTALLRTSG